MSLSQYYYSVYAHGVLADTAHAGVEHQHVGAPFGDELTPPPRKEFAESSTEQRCAKRAASQEDEEVVKGNGKRRRTATESLQTDKENPISCPRCKKMFSTRAILRRHGNCAVGVRDRKHHSCSAEGCKSRFTRRDALTRHVRRFHSQAGGSNPAMTSADKPGPTPPAVLPSEPSPCLVSLPQQSSSVTEAFLATFNEFMQGTGVGPEPAYYPPVNGYGLGPDEAFLPFEIGPSSLPPALPDHWEWFLDYL